MGRFTSEEINLAKKVQDRYGVPASVTLAQYALESGYGKSTVGRNNYFNIKGNGNGGYRNYSSKEESFMDFGKLLSSKRYTDKTSSAGSVQEYVQGVKNAGYAEDSNYVSKVMSIIKSNNLTQYDSGDYKVSGSHAGGSFASTEESDSTLDLKWWGDIVKVVMIILLCIAGVALLATSFGSSLDIASPEKIVKKVVKGGK